MHILHYRPECPNAHKCAMPYAGLACYAVCYEHARGLPDMLGVAPVPAVALDMLHIRLPLASLVNFLVAFRQEPCLQREPITSMRSSKISSSE